MCRPRGERLGVVLERRVAQLLGELAVDGDPRPHAVRDCDHLTTQCPK